MTERMNRAAVLAEVWKERERQNSKWGDRSLHTVHDPLRAVAVLTEEVGEIARSAVEWSAENVSPEPRAPGVDALMAQIMVEYREELIQVAAVAVAMVQALDGPE